MKSGEDHLVPCAVLTMIDKLALQCAKETLDTGIVPTVPSSRHAAGHAVRGEQLLVRGSGILAPPIRVVQQPRLGSAMVDRHRQRLLREITGQPSPQRPADHRARVEVEDHRQIEPALRSPDIGDVPGPHLVGLRDRELAIERVRRDGQSMMGLGGGSPFLHGLGTNPFGTHEPRDAVLADAVPPLDQGVPDTGTAVGLAGLAVDHPDHRDERTVGRPTHTLRPHSPAIAAGG
jgi:hypothetical protein